MKFTLYQHFTKIRFLLSLVMWVPMNAILRGKCAGVFIICVSFYIQAVRGLSFPSASRVEPSSPVQHAQSRVGKLKDVESCRNVGADSSLAPLLFSISLQAVLGLFSDV